MDLSRRVELITTDSQLLAAAAGRDLTARVPSCPGWSTADLVRHVLEVHRSWSRIVADGRTEPDWRDEPVPNDADLVRELLAGALRFADVLGRTDPEQPCWTWGPEQNAGFVQRFQVQEAALHRWDAEQAVGTPAPITTDTPVDVTLRPNPDTAVVGARRGTASDLLLVYWRRLPLDTVDVSGDGAAIAATIGAADLD